MGKLMADVESRAPSLPSERRGESQPAVLEEAEEKLSSFKRGDS